MTSNHLASQTQKTAGLPNNMRTATVTVVSNTGVTISLAGGTLSSGVGVLGSYAPAVGDVVAVFRQTSSWLIVGLISPVGGTGSRRLGSSGAPTGTGNADAHATSSTVESVYDIVTVYVVAGRTYHIKCFFPYLGTTANDRFLIRLRAGSTTADTQITYCTAFITVISVVDTVTPENDWTASTTGPQSFCVTAQLSSGSGTLTPKGAVTQTRLLTVEQVAF